MFVKERIETMNNNYVRNKITKLSFEKRNEEIKNIITTKQFILRERNKNVNNVPSDSVVKIPNNDRRITDKTYSIIKNRSKGLFNVIPSAKGNFKLKRCPEHFKMTLVKTK